MYHIYNDSTINDLDGSAYYICSGVQVIVEASAGSIYYMEDNSEIIILSQSGDVVNAKANCVIIDSTSQNIIVNKEASSTFLKPFMTSLGIVFTCEPMLFDYSLIGGTSPCNIINDISHLQNENLTLYPNPTNGNFTVDLGERYSSISTTITDLTGKAIWSSKFYERKVLNLNIEAPAGVYLLSIEFGEKRSVIRLIKE